MLTKYLKKTNLPLEEKENKEFLMKKLGFFDINAEYASTIMIDEKVLKVAPAKPDCQPIHEEVIREVDEGPPDMSLNDINENKEGLDNNIELLNKPFGTLTNYKRPSTNLVFETKKILMEHLVLPSELSEKKKVNFSGMLGLKKIPQQELKAIFNSPMIVPDADDFTEAFFNIEPITTYPADQEKDKTKKDIVSPREPTKHLSSFLELDQSNIQPESKEGTPNCVKFEPNFDPDASPLDGLLNLPFKSAPENFPKSEKWITEAERKKKEVYFKQITTVKEENTNVSSTSPATTLCESNVKFHKRKTNNQKPIEEEEGKKITIVEPNDKILDKDAKNYLSANSPEKKEPKIIKAIDTPIDTQEAIFEEKFILKIGDITAESTSDVLPRKAVAINLPEIKVMIQHVVPPYKMKLILIPTEWPVEVPIDENETVKSECLSNNESSRKNSTGREGGEEASSASGLSKNSKLSGRSKSKRRTSKKKPKAKKKKGKKGVDDSSSKHSTGSKKKTNKSTSGPTPSENGSRNEESKHSFNDAASAMGSISPDSKKEEKKEEEKKDQNDNKISNEIQKNQITEGVSNKPEYPWSGQEVLIDCDPFSAVWITDKITNIRIWPHGNKGLLANVRCVVRKFVNSDLCENFMNLLVIINTVTLAMDRYQQPSSESAVMDKLNYIFTSIFTAELSLKLFGLGLVKYLSDSLNYLDSMVVLFSWVEIIFLGGGGAISAFRTLRVFRLVRTVRVLRVARLLRGLQSMMTLMEVISNTMGSFGYIGLMLLIIMLIYALFGMTLFAGRWNYPDGLPRPNFDSFNNAFISVFQLMTVENWPTLLYSGLRNSFQPLVALYYISFILIGNYILLNMFLAIMLDSFVEVSAAQDDGDDEEVIICLYFYRKKRILIVKQDPIFH